MTDDDLDRIETILGVTLPASYRGNRRAVSLGFDGLRHCLWLFHDPDEVIGNSQVPLLDGDYDGTNWCPAYVAIGDSGAGDLYVLDTALDPAPILLLSHEDHAFTDEAPDLATFIANWKRERDEADAWAEAALQEDHRRDRHRWRFLLALFMLLRLFPATVVLMGAAEGMGVPHHGASILVPLSLVAAVALIRVMISAVKQGIHY